MVELYGEPFGNLVRRMLREPAVQGTCFDLPRERWWRPREDLDLGVSYMGRPAATPVGPASGPHGQMAQNLVLAWLAGSRVLELKTVQVLDELEIPRPCIDVPNIGYNVEWSQELRVEDSLREYVAAAMLVEIASHEDILGLGRPGATGACQFDLSLGYDLEGIRGDKVRRFVKGMQDARAVIDLLRREIPDDRAHLRDLPYPTNLGHNVTLSTFHGCPPAEIESIAEYVMTEYGLDCVVKMNPTLLGPERLRSLLADRLGYTELVVNDEAFARNIDWDGACSMIERLTRVADRAGRRVGVKFTNTLEVRNHRGVLAPDVMYVSGEPLHALAVQLVADWRAHWGDRAPVSFSAGANQGNFVRLAAAGLVPVTTCTDLLKTGGYGRLSRYLAALEDALLAAGTPTLNDFLLRWDGHGTAALEAVFAEAREAVRADPRAGEDGRGRATQWLDRLEAALRAELARPDGCRTGPHIEAHAAELGGLGAVGGLTAWIADLPARLAARAAVANTPRMLRESLEDPSIRRDRTAREPKKIGKALAFFDCVSCDKCVPVCPNDANFMYPVRRVEGAATFRLTVGADGSVRSEPGPAFSLAKDRQWANYADACNECGNCETYCPEDGGPFRRKPVLFGGAETFTRHADRDGGWIERDGEEVVLRIRREGAPYVLRLGAEEAVLEDSGIRVRLRAADGTVRETAALAGARGGHVLDTARFHEFAALVRGVLDPIRIHAINARWT